MAPSKEVDSESEWDLCEDAPRANLPELDDKPKDPKETAVADEKLPEALAKVKISSSTAKKGKTETSPRSAHPDPKFYPVEAAPRQAQSSGEDSVIEAIPEGDGVRKTLAEMEFTAPISALPTSFLRAVANRFSREQVLQRYAAADPLPFFVCGSLMFPATLRAITNGLTLEAIAGNMCPAVLRGFRRRCVPWAEWPAIVPASGANGEEVVIHGMLLFGMAESQRASIHRFEGGMFDLRRVTVQLELNDGSMWNHEAGLYVWNGSESRLVPLAQKQWSPDMLLRSRWHLSNIARVSDEEQRSSLARD